MGQGARTLGRQCIEWLYMRSPVTGIRKGKQGSPPHVPEQTWVHVWSRNATWDGRRKVFDDYLAQLGEDTAAYCRTVCQTIVLTVPKAIVHCQVRAASAAPPAQRMRTCETDPARVCPCLPLCPAVHSAAQVPSRVRLTALEQGAMWASVWQGPH